MRSSMPILRRALQLCSLSKVVPVQILAMFVSAQGTNALECRSRAGLYGWLCTYI